MNHYDLDAKTIRASKTGWEAFVAETAKDPSSLLATACLYGSGDAIHSMTLAFHGADGRQVFQRVYHLIDGPPERWAEWAVGEVAWLGAQIKLALINEQMPVDHCPSCTHGMTVATSAGFARRLASTTWESCSMCSIYVNPEQASLAIRIEDDVGEAFSAAVHRCGALLDITTSTYHERVPIAARPSVRTQTTKLVRKLPPRLVSILILPDFHHTLAAIRRNRHFRMVAEKWYFFPEILYKLKQHVIAFKFVCLSVYDYFGHRLLDW